MKAGPAIQYLEIHILQHVLGFVGVLSATTQGPAIALAMVFFQLGPQFVSVHHLVRHFNWLCLLVVSRTQMYDKNRLVSRFCLCRAWLAMLGSCHPFSMHSTWAMNSASIKPAAHFLRHSGIGWPGWWKSIPQSLRSNSFRLFPLLKCIGVLSRPSG